MSKTLRRWGRLLLLLGLVVALAVLAGACGGGEGTPQAPAGESGGGAHQVRQQSNQATAEALYQQGYQAFNRGDYQAAVAAADAALKLNPRHVRAYVTRGIALCYAGNFRQGMQSIDRALALNPEDAAARFNKALAYELYGYYDTALVWYRRTLEVNRDNVWCYYGIASIYGRRGDVPHTVRYLQEAIRRDPTVKQHARTEKDFDNVRGSREFQELVR